MNKIKFFRILGIFILLAFFVSCSAPTKIVYKEGTTRLYEIPKDWEKIEVREKAIKKFSKYLKGKKIFIDPGHGGEDKRNKSATGNVVEANVNLRVSQYLIDYLKRAGAVVYFSRNEDKTVELKERSKIANLTDAEIFISVHHNASPSYENDWSNYTSTFYHSRKGKEGYVPAAHNLAKFVQRDLAYVMRNSGGLGSFDGTYSDFRIYPDEGFSVLRESKIPAILVECSFFNAFNEEQRLQINEFNQIQAWGIFRGIYKYYLNGVPEIIFLQNESLLKNSNLSLVFEINSNVKILESSIEILFNNEKVNFDYHKSSKKILLFVENVKKGNHKISVECKNVNGNYSFPFVKEIKTR